MFWFIYWFLHFRISFETKRWLEERSLNFLFLCRGLLGCSVQCLKSKLRCLGKEKLNMEREGRLFVGIVSIKELTHLSFFWTIFVIFLKKQLPVSLYGKYGLCYSQLKKVFYPLDKNHEWEFSSCFIPGIRDHSDLKQDACEIGAREWKPSTAVFVTP